MVVAKKSEFVSFVKRYGVVIGIYCYEPATGSAAIWVIWFDEVNKHRSDTVAMKFAVDSQPAYLYRRIASDAFLKSNDFIVSSFRNLRTKQLLKLRSLDSIIGNLQSFSLSSHNSLCVSLFLLESPCDFHAFFSWIFLRLCLWLPACRWCKVIL